MLARTLIRWRSPRAVAGLGFVGTALLVASAGLATLLPQPEPRTRPRSSHAPYVDGTAPARTARALRASEGPVVGAGDAPSPCDVEGAAPPSSATRSAPPAARTEPSGVELARGTPRIAPPGIDALRARIADRNPDVRRRAVRQLLLAADKAQAAELGRGALHDPDGRVRAEAAYALGRLHDPSSTPALLAVLEDPERSVRFEAIDALWRIGDPQSAASLERIAASGDFAMRRKALRALAAFGGSKTDEAQSELLGQADSMMNDTDPDVRRQAIKVIRDMGDSRQFPVLQAGAQDPDPSVREKAAEGLARLGGVRARAILEALAKDPDHEVRRAAKASLALLKGL